MPRIRLALLATTFVVILSLGTIGSVQADTDAAYPTTNNDAWTGGSLNLAHKDDCPPGGFDGNETVCRTFQVVPQASASPVAEFGTFNFAFSSFGRIQGIEVKLDGMYSTAPFSTTFDVFLSFGATDTAIKTTASVPSGCTLAEEPADNLCDTVLGSPTDTWGMTTLTPASFRNENGFSISLQAHKAAEDAAVVGLDNILVQVYWDFPFTVVKDFSDDSDASVTVTLTCGEIATISGSSGSSHEGSGEATEGAPAEFSVTDVGQGDPTCTASEDPDDTIGYTVSGSCITGVPVSAATCTLTNTSTASTPATFTVYKNWTNADGPAVIVTLECSSGTVSAPQTADNGAPATFTVTGAQAGATCTASEGPMPGLTVAGTCSTPTVVGTTPASCTITNTVPAQCAGMTFDRVIVGTGDNDTLAGTGLRDLILGGGGADTLSGGAGNDCLIGGEGNDRLSGGSGNDKLLGDAGSDRLNGDSGTDAAVGGTQSDTCDAESETTCES